MGINENMKKVNLSIFIVNLLKAAQATHSQQQLHEYASAYIYLHAYEFIYNNNWSQIIIQEFRQLTAINIVTEWYEK